VIYRAIWQNQVVAVKSLTGSTQEDAKQKAFDEFRREVWVMSGMRHPNLVNLLGFCVNPFAIVMEFVEFGNLYNFLRKQDELSWSLRLKIALDIARGSNVFFNSRETKLQKNNVSNLANPAKQMLGHVLICSCLYRTFLFA